MRLVFMGTPDFAVPTLAALAEAGHAIAAVYTRAAAASGRGLKARPSPVEREARRLGVPVETPASLRDLDAALRLAAYAPEVAIVVAYGLLLPPAILAVPRHGCLNLHASLLPRWRGAAPIHRAVMAGDAETGVAVMRMEAGLDTGPVGLEHRQPIPPDATTGDLHDALAQAGAALMVAALAALDGGTLVFAPQAEAGVTYARKIANEEARIDWDRTARAVHDQIRGLAPAPGAYFEADLGRGLERVKVLASEIAAAAGPPGALLAGGLVACREGAIRPLRLQRAGKGPVTADEFWRGTRTATLGVGTR